MVKCTPEDLKPAIQVLYAQTEDSQKEFNLKYPSFIIIKQPELRPITYLFTMGYI
jgi:hypothetical protein